jgi:hypothetical protein
VPVPRLLQILVHFLVLHLHPLSQLLPLLTLLQAQTLLLGHLLHHQAAQVPPLTAAA